ncbi:MAG: ABC transporter permease [Bdellovibrionales bacterium]|nr:ABC transporter permease [Bdellovibrionales bacterium]
MSLVAIRVVAKNTYLEVIRDRVLYVLVMFAVVFLGLCFAIGQLSYDEIFRLSMSMGLAGIHICFIGLTIFLGSAFFYREIESKTIYTIVVRPISRSQYLLGKYLGLLAVLSVLLLGFILAFTLIQLLMGLPILATTYSSFLGVFLESALLLTVTFFFSSISKPFIAITTTVCFFLIGHWVSSLDALVAKSDSAVFYVAGNVIVRAFPQLEALNWRPFAIAKVHVGLEDLSFGIYLTLAWSLLFFILSVMIFRRKDLV